MARSETRIGDYLVIRINGEKVLDICQDSKENRTFSSASDAAKLASSLSETAKLGEDFLIARIVA